MKKFFYFLLFLFLSLLGVTFTIQNPQDVLVQYYLGFTWHGPLVILVAVSLAIGIVIGSLAGLVKNLRLRRRKSRNFAWSWSAFWQKTARRGLLGLRIRPCIRVILST